MIFLSGKETLSRSRRGLEVVPFKNRISLLNVVPHADLQNHPSQLNLKTICFQLISLKVGLCLSHWFW
ncbi:Uncharacterized protein APZ42_015362 [Daphnia magna]|uniref:Uncharacterized protein n=1 Tax=Daphnia magna TaxID=35525 RepID=A0A162PE30_9CRUS|nr:Uncharacterized protein APZ42_015362 [Daphnia magna]